MESRDFRLGNMVNSISGDKLNLIKITALGKDYVSGSTVSKEIKRYPIEMVVIEPIHDEWISNLGFAYSYWGSLGPVYIKPYGHLGETRYLILQSEDEDILIFNVFIAADGDLMDVTAICSVHELQNLYYSLTGEEL